MPYLILSGGVFTQFRTQAVCLQHALKQWRWRLASKHKLFQTETHVKSKAAQAALVVSSRCGVFIQCRNVDFTGLRPRITHTAIDYLEMSWCSNRAVSDKLSLTVKSEFISQMIMKSSSSGFVSHMLLFVALYVSSVKLFEQLLKNIFPVL